MSARLAAQEAHRDSAVETRVKELALQWVAALNDSVEKAFNSEWPVESVSVASNQLEVGSTKTPFEDVITLAADRVTSHFLTQKGTPGFNAWKHVSKYGWVSVEVVWGTPPKAT